MKTSLSAKTNVARAICTRILCAVTTGALLALIIACSNPLSQQSPGKPSGAAKTGAVPITLAGSGGRTLLPGNPNCTKYSISFTGHNCAPAPVAEGSVDLSSITPDQGSGVPTQYGEAVFRIASND